MELLIQPADGLTPLLKTIDRAKSSVEITIFRCDRIEVEKALANAAARGVRVSALIASTNRNGERNLRDLEQRLLAQGVTVARTASDLARYHGKLLIIDRRILCLLAFNLTYLDLKLSRSFGVVTTKRPLVQEAARLFEADVRRQPYTAGLPGFAVSPVNARRQLAALLKRARKELLIYDPAVTDPSMVRLLEGRAAAGVRVRVIGRLARKSSRLEVRRMPRLRLHTRTILRDGREAFIGSQSLRPLELDARREVGILFQDTKTIRRLAEVFAEDWALAGRAQHAEEEAAPAGKVAKRVAKALAEGLPPVAPVLDSVMKEVGGGANAVDLDPDQVEESVHEVVKDAVREVVKNVVEESADAGNKP